MKIIVDGRYFTISTVNYPLKWRKMYQNMNLILATNTISQVVLKYLIAGTQISNSGEIWLSQEMTWQGKPKFG